MEESADAAASATAQLEEIQAMFQSAKEELKSLKKSAKDMQSALEAILRDKEQINANFYWIRKIDESRKKEIA